MPGCFGNVLENFKLGSLVWNRVFFRLRKLVHDASHGRSCRLIRIYTFVWQKTAKHFLVSRISVRSNGLSISICVRLSDLAEGTVRLESNHVFGPRSSGIEKNESMMNISRRRHPRNAVAVFSYTWAAVVNRTLKSRSGEEGCTRSSETIFGDADRFSRLIRSCPRP